MNYIIPYQGKYVIYSPLKRLAFIGNAALVKLIAKWQTSISDEDIETHTEAFNFLQTIGFFAPDQSSPEPCVSTEIFKPTIAVCLLTTACNFRCVYCYASGGERAIKELDVKLGQRAIDVVCQNAMDLEQESFSLSFHGGGEPTLAKDNLRKLVRYARSKPIPCEISVASNGYWTPRHRDWILTHLDQVSLSFDGTQMLQDKQRPLASGKGTFPVVMTTIQTMDKMLFPYGIRVTVTDAGIEHLSSAVEFLCHETACPTFQVEPAFNHGRAHANSTALDDNQRFATAFLQAYDIAFANKRNLYYSGARPWVITEHFCQAVDKALIVAPGGGLTACYEVYGEEHQLSKEFFFGSLTPKGQVHVNSEVRTNLQRKIAERRDLCKDCFCYWHCAGDCPPKTFSADGMGHRQFGVRCDLNRLITLELLVRNIATGNGVWQGNATMQQQLCEA